MMKPSAVVIAILFGTQCNALIHSTLRRVLFETPHVSRTILKSKSSWGVGENWSILSSEAEEDSSWATTQKMIDPLDLAVSVLESAAQPIERAVDTSISDAINRILSSPPETDAALLREHSEATGIANSVSEQEANEIGLLIRCNEIPDTMLVEEGRGLQPLSNKVKFDAAQLLLIAENKETDENQIFGTVTPFFIESVLHIFQQHCTLDEASDSLVMNRDGVAKWMMSCLKDESSVSKNDKRVLEVISRFSTAGTGFLSQQQFLKLYTEVLHVDFDMSRGKFKPTKSGRMSSVEKIWRDFTAHDIQSPNEVEWHRKQTEMTAASLQNKMRPRKTNLLYDECEILELNRDNASPHWSIDDSQGVTNLRRGSHQLVELCKDGETPKRIRDGEFVFIDEESCIGCTQCVHAAPSSFMMLDTGRARTFHQSNAQDVKSAVLTCPVNCMKFMSFQELKELEVVRDSGGDEDSSRRTMRHTPLYVAGIDSDANHKDSWYHILKQKCSTSSNCPQKGCYDCPKYSTAGENPYFKERQIKAHSIRMNDFMQSDELNALRKIAEL